MKKSLQTENILKVSNTDGSFMHVEFQPDGTAINIGMKLFQQDVCEFSDDPLNEAAVGTEDLEMTSVKTARKRQSGRIGLDVSRRL